jgi:hypothetical protein
MKSSVARRADLKAALKRFKKGETITLDDIARLWGVTKPRFLNIRNDIADFPEPIGKQANALLYDAKPTLECLLNHETRNDQAVAKRSSKVARILGASKADEEEPLPPTEMLALARAGAERDKRLREQGMLVKFTDVQQVASEVFGEMSSTLSKLSDLVDPNGKLPAHVRDLVDGGGKDVLLRLYNRFNDMLGGNADLNAHPAAANRARPHRARRPRPRPGSKKGVRARA